MNNMINCLNHLHQRSLGSYTMVFQWYSKIDVNLGKKNILPLHKLHLLTIEKFKVIRTISRPIVNELFNRTKGNNYNLRNPCLWITTTTSVSMLLTSQAGAGSFCFNLGVFRNLLDTPALIEITLNQFFHSFRDIHGPLSFFLFP